MFARKFVVAAALVAVAGLLAQLPASARPNFNKTMYLTFSRSVQLPGVTLAAGTYTFELADPIGATDIVRVLSRNYNQLYFLGFTRRVERPANLRPGQLVAFGEAAPGTPPPITVWYPADDSQGREFVYPR